MILDLMLHATDQATFRTGMVTYGFATVDEDGSWVPRADVAIDEIGPITRQTTPPVTIDGWHVNIRVTGALADQVTAGLPQTNDDGSLKSVFDRTIILQMIPGLAWEAIPTDQGVPAGYQLADGTRLYDPATVKHPARVWA